MVDKEANAHGGMLVIATSIPDEREWIQWKGRTARQDRPGQFFVILDESQKPFNDPKQGKKLKDKVRKRSGGKGGAVDAAEEDAKVEMLLEVADDGIGERLKSFEGEQERGEKLNELTEKYYARCPRGADDPWPKTEFIQGDSVLRKFLTSWTEKKPSEIKQLAKSELDFDLD